MATGGVPRVVVVSRWGDSLDAGRVCDELAEVFGEENVVCRVDVPSGVGAAEHIDRRVADADVVLFLIGPRWERRRSQDEDRAELHMAAALRHQIPAIPVLITRTDLPESDASEPALSALATQPAETLRGGRWLTHDFDRLLRRLAELPRSHPSDRAGASSDRSSIPATDKPLVFVSYALEDEGDITRGPLSELRRVGGDRYEFLSRWEYHFRTEGPVGDWDTMIVEAVHQAEALLFFMTPRSLQSGSARQEVIAASTEGIPIIPVVLDEECETALDNQLRFHLMRHWWISAYAMSQTDMVDQIVARLPAPRPQSDTTPEAREPVVTRASGGHVFISYSRDDQEYVDQLFSHLERAGLEPWIDRAGIDYGTRWAHVVSDAVDTCTAFIVVMTPEAEESEWVERELVRAQDGSKPILPLLLRGKTFFRVGNVHYEDVTGGQMPGDAFVARLREAQVPRGQR
jgi:hypothetical protein